MWGFPVRVQPKGLVLTGEERACAALGLFLGVVLGEGLGEGLGEARGVLGGGAGMASCERAREGEGVGEEEEFKSRISTVSRPFREGEIFLLWVE